MLRLTTNVIAILFYKPVKSVRKFDQNTDRGTEEKKQLLGSAKSEKLIIRPKCGKIPNHVKSKIYPMSLFITTKAPLSLSCSLRTNNFVCSEHIRYLKSWTTIAENCNFLLPGPAKMDLLSPYEQSE